MNVVGRVGSFISQGVYSVATPFHPFGGAVDVIVVQQPDGTFRSTPWYVRFGKFQGVLKGAEKIVRISVNGVEANFHMYLDNSGEAYFIREVESGKHSEVNGVVTDSGKSDCNRRLDHSVSDSGVTQLRGKYEFSHGAQIERAESDVEKRYYEIENGQSLLEGSDELSEYGSNRYDSLDDEHFTESQALSSEVILVSVDGHVLTAPISASEQNTENLQLSTPQFHLGPGDSTEFSEDNVEFSSGDNAWAADYFSKLNESTVRVASDIVCNINNDDDASKHVPEVCEGLVEHVHQAREIQSSRNLEGDLHRHSDLEDLGTSVKREDIFKSCLQLEELVKLVENGNFEDRSSPSEVKDSQNKSSNSPPGVHKTEERNAVVECINSDGLSPSCNSDLVSNNGSLDLQVEVTEHMASDEVFVHSVGNDAEANDQQFDMSAAAEEVDNSLRRTATQDESSASEILEPQTTPSEGIQPQSNLRFEISLCGSELRAGMGLTAAAEAFDARRISADEFKSTAASITNNENLIIRFVESYWTWEKAAPFVLGMAAFGLELPVEHKDAIPVVQDETLKQENDSVSTPTSSGRRWRLWPIPFRRVKTLEHASSSSSNEDVFVDTESGLHNSQFESTPPASPNTSDSPRKQLLRTNVPTNEQIASLNLKEGQNMITFSFSTRVLGKQQVDAHIYLWKWNARIVISDVDGTITKSDVLGQFMPLVGKDWTQSGVARLFSAIKENGYQLLFLSARAIVQAYLTRSFLLNLKQDGKALPNGPVVISPDGLFPSLYREVIRRAPHEFKISCLEDIKKLFPSDYNPFYAGFGNRDTDELSYRKIGIPKGKIFIINPKGEVAISHCIDVRSYTSLHTLVNDMFPPITSSVEQEDYNSWNYWRVPLQDIDN